MAKAKGEVQQANHAVQEAEPSDIGGREGGGRLEIGLIGWLRFQLGASKVMFKVQSFVIPCYTYCILLVVVVGGCRVAVPPSVPSMPSGFGRICNCIQWIESIDGTLPKLGGLYGSPSKRHLGVCTIHSETTVFLFNVFFICTFLFMFFNWELAVGHLSQRYV